jgi:hypothetical protein
MRTYFPISDSVGFGLFGTRNSRAHYPEVAAMLEEWYDVSAEKCGLFINASEVNKYSVTCTVCRHFDATGCGSVDLQGPSIIKLLDAARVHDAQHLAT